MKTRHTRFALLLALCFQIAGSAWGQPLGTAFTYQGRLTDGATAANGKYDVKFTLYDAATSGSVVAGPVTQSPVAVSNGLFAVSLDFGAEAFAGAARWLELGVRSNGAGGDFTLLSPRQPLTPAPYALYTPRAGAATTAATATAMPWAGLTGLPAGFADGVDNDTTYTAGTGLNLSGTVFSLNTAYTDDRYWKMGGNTGITPSTDFLGTTDGQPLNLYAGKRALRLEPGTIDQVPNIIGGCPANYVWPGRSGSTIGGGGNNYFANSIDAEYGTIGGGEGSRADADHSTISGGKYNMIFPNSLYASIGGGFVNYIAPSSPGSSIGGGTNNHIAANCRAATIAGGNNNSIGTNSTYGVVGGGGYNSIAPRSLSSAIAGGYLNTILTNSSQSFIGGGTENSIATDRACIVGGEQNTIQTNTGNSFIGAGKENTIEEGGKFQFLGGGWKNTMKDGSSFSVLAGGTYNTNWGFESMVLGGSGNAAAGKHSLAAGYRAKANHDGAFVWADDSSVTAFPSTMANEVSFRCVGGMRLQTDRGISLNASDAPIITRGFDPFTSNAGADKAGLGRWGLFMEPSVLALGMPAMANRYVAITKFNTNGTRTDLMMVNQAGTVTAIAFNPTSDRNAKENFAPLNPREVLEKVAALPISTWNFKEDAGTLHAGPMAQDFHAAFGLGTDDRHIATVDADGVALAAIQGLNQEAQTTRRQTEARTAKLELRLQEKEREIAELKQRLERLERRLDM